MIRKSVQQTIERGSGLAYDEACRALVVISEGLYASREPEALPTQELKKFMADNMRHSQERIHGRVREYRFRHTQACRATLSGTCKGTLAKKIGGQTRDANSNPPLGIVPRST